MSAATHDNERYVYLAIEGQDSDPYPWQAAKPCSVRGDDGATPRRGSHPRPDRRHYDPAVFSPAERRDLRDCLVAFAQADDRISAAAVVGSAATHGEDEWSDIDLAFRLAAGLEAADVVDVWTGRMYEDHGAIDHLDVWSESTLFRVFLLPSTLQVDLSFWP